MILKRINGHVIYESETLCEICETHKTNLQMADLRGADLCEAKLSEADLSEADLSGAKLSRADLCEAKLSEANLRRAYLREADLSEADLRGADLHEAKGIIQVGPVPTSGRIGYCVDHGDKVMVQLGCWWSDLDATLARIREQYTNAKGEAYAKLVESAAECLVASSEEALDNLLEGVEELI